MRRRLMLAAAVLGVVAAACAGGERAAIVAADQPERPEPVEGPLTLEHEVEPGPVWVIATFDPAAPEQIDLAFDTHSVDLAFDVDAFVMLRYEGTSIPIGEWDGTEPGGHHRWGTLSMPRAPQPGQLITFTFTGFAESVTFRWTMP